MASQFVRAANVASTSPSYEIGKKVAFSSMFLKRKKSQRFGASSFSKFHHNAKKSFATPRTVLQRAKKSLCNRSQFRTLFLPHRFMKMKIFRFVLPISDPSALNFSTICRIPEFPGINPKRKSCENVRIRRKRTTVQRKSHGHLKKSFGMNLACWQFGLKNKKQKCRW